MDKESTLTTGLIPEELKMYLVTPIYKSDDTNKFTNYRPESVLSFFSKVLEKFMYKSLMQYIERTKFSTNTNMVIEVQ